MTAELKTGVCGFFKIEGVDAESGERRVLADWFPNLITNIGLNRLGAGGTHQSILVGSGSTEPSVSDTQLESFVAMATTSQADTVGYNSTTAPYYVRRRWTRRFAQGAAAGNLTEVGVSWATTGNGAGSLWSRALIKDGNGNPVPITVTASEFLDVTYELRYYPPAADSTFNLTIAGVTHACTLRAAEITTVYSWMNGIGDQAVVRESTSTATGYGGVIGAVTASPSGTVVAVGTGVNQPYVNNSLERTATLSCGLNDGNIAGGLRSVLFYSSVGSYQCQFDPPINKTSSKLLTLNLRVSWARR